ncbi:AAA family ATPase [Lutibaculum baratangense]|uniref:Type II/IV secretion system ATPase TadZ/CpaE, associated with Flp pilus assembly n=1 Tax=Lutibaculum baratangense AMV1 TaxID=631454 RepID=V4RFA3_9HYPH|nr:CpaE family protein [Lutibaculum baratangense]ESR24821.1 Type II/IV secretion system ATPase TadZ/CpaE, associated with Flp pilus assembly [Lutibaculum baratangense AMV1]
MSMALRHDAEAASEPRSEVQSNFIPPLPRVTIQCFCETSPLHAALTQASADRRVARAHMTVQMGGIAAAVQAYADQPTPNVVVLESTANAQAMLDMLDQFAERCDPGTNVIIVGHTNDISLYRALKERGVSDYLVAPVPAMEALRALSSIYESAEASTLGRTVAFLGAKGGVGSSTIAHNVGWSIARDTQNDVVIADLDLPFGTAGLDFNQDPPQGIAEAIYSPERLDEVYLERLLSKCTDHLSIIAAPSTLEREYDLGGDAVEPVIDMIRKTVPVVVLDVPHLWTRWAKGTVQAADEIVITAMPDLANLRNAKNLIDLIKQTRPNDRPPHLVINQAGVPKKPEIGVADFAAALEIEPSAVIAFEPQLFATASNNGQMIAEMQANAKPVEAFRLLATTLSGRGEVRRPKKSAFGPLLERLRLKKG